jgi:serine/threonine protein phosphatase PrpC
VITPDTTQIQLDPEDVLLLCSDGLHGPLPAAEIAYVIAQREDLQAAAQRLVAIANERDGSDNVSVQLIRIHSVERMGMYRGRPYKLR